MPGILIPSAKDIDPDLPCYYYAHYSWFLAHHLLYRLVTFRPNVFKYRREDFFSC